MNLIEAAAIAESAGGSVTAQFSILGVEDAEATAHRIGTATKVEPRYYDGPSGKAWIIVYGNATYVIGEGQI